MTAAFLFIPHLFHIFNHILGVHGIDNYIEYGGTMSIGGINYNGTFTDIDATNEYVDSSIAKNIQHSLKYYQYGNHFRHLYSLYENNELTNAIQRVVEGMNHRFALDVLERDFRSSDYALSAKNLRKDRQKPSSILDEIDIQRFTKTLKEKLEIKNKDEQIIPIDNDHVKEIQEYLGALDLIKKISVDDLDSIRNSTKKYVFSQPGLRYSQAKFFLESLNNEDTFQRLTPKEKNSVMERILNEIRGRMLEDIVALETKIAHPEQSVFKLQFSDGEIDMVLCDTKNCTVELFEIKHSTEANSKQTRHLLNLEQCAKIEKRYGDITKKAVLYRGETKKVDDVDYINVEEYLLQLG